MTGDNNQNSAVNQSNKQGLDDPGAQLIAVSKRFVKGTRSRHWREKIDKPVSDPCSLYLFLILPRN